MNEINRVALFRLSVLGPLVSREQLQRGELQRIIRQLAQCEYAIPDSDRRLLGEKTIQAWYYAWRKGGIGGLVPKVRLDRGQSKISAAVQEAILAAKRENPRRSINQIERLLVAAGLVANDSLSRSSVHRLLQQNGLSQMRGSASLPQEKRSFTAEFAGSIWYGDVMHGPRVAIKGTLRKTYLVSLIDDASRLVAHSAFCLGETALDIEGVLKQALLRRGVPVKIIVDNGAAYRAATLQGVCARFGIHLIFCRPYAPEGKGKLERWHRTFRDQFLSELDERRIADLADLNARLWAWIEQVYHQTVHGGLAGLTPLARYQRDLPRIRSLGAKAAQLDALFLHRVQRFVRKDATVSYLGQRFEVPYELSGKTVRLVVDPHAQRVVGVEDAAGASLGAATPLEPNYRRAQLWRDIKQRVHEMVDSKQLTPVWIIDEAQNLPAEFFRDFPSFLNFAFDSRDLMTVWLVGHPVLAQALARAPCAALHSRIQVHVQLKPVLERERFALLIAHALKSAGCQHNLLADTGLEILRQASKGLPRQAGRILCTAMRLATPKGLNHLPDELLQQAIAELQ